MRHETYLEFDILTVELPFCNFLLVSSSNHMSISHPLAGIAPQANFFSYLIISPTFQTLLSTLTPGQWFHFFQKMERFLPWVRGKASAKNGVDRFNIFDILQKDTHKVKVRYPAQQSWGGV